MNEKVTRLAYWRWLMAGILLLVSAVKVLDLLRGFAQVEPPDPVTGMSLWIASSLAAAAEVGVALLVAFGPRKLSSYALLLLGAVFTAHGILLAIYGVARCPCLGSRLPWHWLNIHAGQVSLSLAIWMLFSSIFWFSTEERLIEAT